MWQFTHFVILLILDFRPKFVPLFVISVCDKARYVISSCFGATYNSIGQYGQNSYQYFHRLRTGSVGHHKLSFCIFCRNYLKFLKAYEYKCTRNIGSPAVTKHLSLDNIISRSLRNVYRNLSCAWIRYLGVVPK